MGNVTYIEHVHLICTYLWPLSNAEIAIQNGTPQTETMFKMVGGGSSIVSGREQVLLEVKSGEKFTVNNLRPMNLRIHCP